MINENNNIPRIRQSTTTSATTTTCRRLVGVKQNNYGPMKMFISNINYVNEGMDDFFSDLDYYHHYDD